jgi:uncharacterized delta-60 repeat protein
MAPRDGTIAGIESTGRESMKALFAAAASILCVTMACAAEPGSFYPVSSLQLADGKTLVAGGVRTERGYTFAVKRVLGNGLPDTTFGADGSGIAQIPFWRYYEFAGVLALQPDGRILVGGNAADSLYRLQGSCYPAFCGYYPVVARLEPDGSLDASFNGSGSIALAIGSASDGPWDVPENGTLTGVSLNPDRTINVLADDSRVVVARLLADGTLDRSFRRDNTLIPREVVFERLQGLWYTPGVDGWRLALSQQGRTLFGIWFLTQETGSPSWGSWLAWVASQVGPNSYSGHLYETRGPDFRATPFDPGRVAIREVGSATLAVDAAGNGNFSYTVGSAGGTKFVRMAGVRPTCTWGAQPDLSLAQNFDGHWWAAPPGSEGGWGLHLTHQGDTIQLAWMTYDETGAPVWFAASTSRRADGSFGGELLHQLRDGGPYGAVPGDFEGVGTVVLSFTDGNAGTFRYTVNGVSQAKDITRFVFEGPGTICSP